MARPSLPKTVLLLGLVSFFTDVGSEMIFPLLPLFLTQSLGASPRFLGLIEGIADTVSSFLKLVSGYLSDRFKRRKPLVLLGYGLAGGVRPLMALATAPWHVLTIRVTDRVGKGIRTAPRDALIADSAPPGQAGRAFGFHRAMDHAGAVVGPLVATVLLSAGLEVRTVFLVAAIPSLVSFLAVMAIREERLGQAAMPEQGAAAPAPSSPSSQASPSSEPSKLPRSMTGYLLILLLFSLGNSSDAFLLLRAHDMGIPDTRIPLLWTWLHVVKGLTAYYGGILADRVPRAWMVTGGWAIYSGVYLGLGWGEGELVAWALFAVYGCYYGLTEPAEKALVQDLAPPDVRGRAFGHYNFVLGLSALPASLITGWVWGEFGAQVALTVGAILAGLASGLLLLWQKMRMPRDR